MYNILFPPKWIDAITFETALATGIGPHNTEESAVLVSVPARAAVMVDASVRLLSLANQLQEVGKRVTLEFSHEDTSSFDYLNRIAFFQHLDRKIVVKPNWPSRSAARFHGTNDALVEIERLVPGKLDRNMPRRLEKALTASIKDPKRRELVGNAAYGLFSELIDNVERHSGTTIAGYAVLQVYKNGVQIAVSDSGLGLLHTLRSALPEHYPHLQSLPPRELLMYALKEGGLSRAGKGHGGAGLKRCADHARSLQANLEIRTANHSLRIPGKHWSKRPQGVHATDKLPLLWGTHLVFDFKLD